jgi:hypothetical protein
VHVTVKNISVHEVHLCASNNVFSYLYLIPPVTKTCSANGHSLYFNTKFSTQDLVALVTPCGISYHSFSSCIIGAKNNRHFCPAFTAKAKGSSLGEEKKPRKKKL